MCSPLFRHLGVHPSRVARTQTTRVRKAVSLLHRTTACKLNTETLALDLHWERECRTKRPTSTLHCKSVIGGNNRFTDSFAISDGHITSIRPASRGPNALAELFVPSRICMYVESRFIAGVPLTSFARTSIRYLRAQNFYTHGYKQAWSATELRVTDSQQQLSPHQFLIRNDCGTYIIDMDKVERIHSDDDNESKAKFTLCLNSTCPSQHAGFVRLREHMKVKGEVCCKSTMSMTWIS